MTEKFSRGKSGKILKPKRPRAWELDVVRGIAILLVCWDHIMFDVGVAFRATWESSGNTTMLAFSDFALDFLYSSLKYYGWGIFVFLFFFVSGICTSFSKSNLLRTIKLGLVAALVSLVTYIASYITGENYYIKFGVLHCFAFCLFFFTILEFTVNFFSPINIQQRKNRKKLRKKLEEENMSLPNINQSLYYYDTSDTGLTEEVLKEQEMLNEKIINTEKHLSSNSPEYDSGYFDIPSELLAQNNTSEPKSHANVFQLARKQNESIERMLDNELIIYKQSDKYKTDQKIFNYVKIVVLCIVTVIMYILNEIYNVPLERMFKDELIMDTSPITGMFIYTNTWNTADYFPLLPFFGFFMLGTIWGHTVYTERKSLLPKLDKKWHYPLSYPGRYSLYIYIGVQVLALLIFYIIASAIS